jgi:hypothetical protein
LFRYRFTFAPIAFDFIDFIKGLNENFSLSCGFLLPHYCYYAMAKHRSLINADVTLQIKFIIYYFPTFTFTWRLGNSIERDFVVGNEKENVLSNNP